MSTTPWDQVDYSRTQEFLANLDRDRHTPLRGDDEAVGVLDDERGHPHKLDADTDDGPADHDEPQPPVPAIPDNSDTPQQITGETTTFADSADPVAAESADTGRTDDPETVSRRFSLPVIVGFVAAVAVATIGLAGVMIGMRPSAKVATAPLDSPTQIAVAPPPSSASGTTGAPPPGGDVPIPYQASSPCPPAGSSSAQNLASDDPARAWVCVRDGDGQVLTLDLGKPMKITAITVTPGWIGTDASGADQWMAHRVLTRVQWILINGDDRTVVTQDTNNIHGPATQAMPSNGPDQGVLASQIQMIVLQTSRPPADTPTGPTPGAPLDAGGGFIDGILGAPLGTPPATTTDDPAPGFGATGPDANSDPVDNTFAVSAVTVLGHSPL